MSNPQGFQNLNPNIQAKILAKINAAKQRQVAAEATIKYKYPRSFSNSNNNSMPSVNINDNNSQYPCNSNYFNSYTLNQIFHIQNNNNMSSKKVFQEAVRCLISTCF